MNTLLLDSNVYSIEAVKRASYDLSREQCFEISQKEGTISIQQYGEHTIPKDKILKAVLDHQLRIETENKFGLIRNLLVAQALEPRDDIGDVIKTLGLNDGDQPR